MMLQRRKRPGLVSLVSNEATVSGRLTLRDGTIAQVRIATPKDRDALGSFFARLSPESRRRRFFSAFLPRPEWVASLCANQDLRSGLTLLVGRPHDEGPQIIATASYLAKDEQSAEVAFAVDDAFQGQGLGTFLLQRLASVAMRNGFTRFWAVTQAENQAMRDVFRDSGFACQESAKGNEIEVSLSLVPSATTAASVPRTHSGRANPHIYTKGPC